MKRLIAILVIIVLLLSLFVPVYAADEAVVYVRDGGRGDGSSKDSPVGTLEDAYSVLLSKSDIKSNPDSVGKIVICGTLTVTDHFNYNGEFSHKGRVIYTSSHGGEHFDARIVIHAFSKSSLSVNDEHRFVLGGPTRFENLTIDRGEGASVSLTIYASTDLHIAETVDVINSNWLRVYTQPTRALTEPEINSILLSAHRGYQPLGPENSILSFEAAGKLGFDYIETDVIMTRDGELVCIHDSTLDRTTNGCGTVSQMTYDEIRKYTIDTASYGFDISSADKESLYVPTFREYLEICKKYGAKPFIEIKDSRENVIRKIIDTALEYFVAEDIVMSCGNLSALETSYEYNRDVFHHLIWGDQSDEGSENSIKVLSKMTNSQGKVNAGIAFNIKGLANNDNYNRAKLWTDKAHDAGLLACLRGADDMTEVRLMFDLGIDYYPTNTTNPEKLDELRAGTEGGYTYSLASGGKLFIRGGSRCEVTEENISITLLGGIYDFVAPSNAEAESTGNYSVTVGGNAFISRLVAGETAKSSSGERISSRVTVKDDAVINDLYIAGDYANTKSVTVEIIGGRVISVSESRGKGGRAEKFDLILQSPSLLPHDLNISDNNVLTGKKTLTVYGEAPDKTEAWDEVIVPTVSTPVTDVTTPADSIRSTETTESAIPRVDEDDNGTTMTTIIVAATALMLIVGLVAVKKVAKRAEK